MLHCLAELTPLFPFADSLLGLEADGSDSDSSSSSSSSAVDAPSPRKRRKMEAFGLEDDCPLFPTLPEYVLEVAAASIQAARELRDGRADVAIAWTGGRCVRSSPLRT